MSEFTLRDKQGVKVGNFHRSGPGTTHFVVVRKDDRAPSYYQRYTVEVDGKHATDIYRSGNGRNLSWRVDNSGTYGGTLAKAVERGVASYLYSLDYAAEENTRVDQIKGSLAYVFKTEAEALDFAFTGTSASPAIVAEYHGAWYVGFYDSDAAEQVVETLNQIPSSRVRVYGRIDPRVVQEALREQGVSGVHFDRTYTETVVYLEQGTGGILRITKNGDVVLDSNDRANVQQFLDAAGETNEDVVRHVVRWWKSYDLQQRAQAFLEYLETEVPAGVAHYAVEDAKKALRTLAHQAFTVDFTFGQ